MVGIGSSPHLNSLFTQLIAEQEARIEAMPPEEREAYVAKLEADAREQIDLDEAVAQMAREAESVSAEEAQARAEELDAEVAKIEWEAADTDVSIEEYQAAEGAKPADAINIDRATGEAYMDDQYQAAYMQMSEGYRADPQVMTKAEQSVIDAKLLDDYSAMSDADKAALTPDQAGVYFYLNENHRYDGKDGPPDLQAGADRMSLEARVDALDAQVSAMAKEAEVIEAAPDAPVYEAEDLSHDPDAISASSDEVIDAEAPLTEDDRSRQSPVNPAMAAATAQSAAQSTATTTADPESSQPENAPQKRIEDEPVLASEEPYESESDTTNPYLIEDEPDPVTPDEPTDDDSAEASE